MGIWLSKSRVGSFKFCPLQYKFRYIEKIETPPSPRMEFGTHVHEFLAKFYDDFDHTEIDCPAVQFRERLPSCHAECSEVADKFAAFEARRWELTKDKSLFAPIHTEVKISDKGRELAGIIDRIDYAGGNYMIGEYKPAWNEYKIPDLRFEWAFYLILLAESIGEGKLVSQLPVYGSVWGYKIGKFYREKISPASIRSAKRWMSKVRQAHEEDDFPAKFWPAKCKYCDYRELCALRMDV